MPTSPVVCISLSTLVSTHNNFVHLALSVVGVMSQSTGRQSVNSTELWVKFSGAHASSDEMFQ